jgi:hypothetical protein
MGCSLAWAALVSRYSHAAALDYAYEQPTWFMVFVRIRLTGRASD